MKKVFKGSAVFTVKLERIEDFKKEVLKIIDPTRKERDNVCYEAYNVIDESGHPTARFEFHELWVSKASMLIEHKENTTHMQHFFKTICFGEKDSWIEKFEISGTDVEIL